MKKTLMTGLITLLPLVLTIMVVIFLFDLFTEPFLPIVTSALTSLHITLPAHTTILVSRLLGLVLLTILILVLGVIARHIVFKKIVDLTHHLFSKIPIAKTVYQVSKDLFNAILSPDGKQAFKDPVLYPFPHAPYYGVGFLTGEAPEECNALTKNKLVSIFAPTAPHPISGFLFLIPQDRIHQTEMSKEEAIKFIVSCGVILPEEKEFHDDHL